MPLIDGRYQMVWLCIQHKLQQAFWAVSCIPSHQAAVFPFFTKKLTQIHLWINLCAERSQLDGGPDLKADPASDGLSIYLQTKGWWALIYLQPGDQLRTVQPGENELQCPLTCVDDWVFPQQLSADGWPKPCALKPTHIILHITPILHWHCFQLPWSDHTTGSPLWDQKSEDFAFFVIKTKDQIIPCYLSSGRIGLTKVFYHNRTQKQIRAVGRSGKPDSLTNWLTTIAGTLPSKDCSQLAGTSLVTLCAVHCGGTESYLPRILWHH